MTSTHRDSAKDITQWPEYLQGEVDAAYLYRELVQYEKDPQKKSLFQQLAAIEDQHISLWTETLTKNGVVVGNQKPSLRARVTAKIGKWFGPSALLHTLAKEEGREIKSYLDLHGGTNNADAKRTALKLARDSAHHAKALQEAAGRSEEPWHNIASGGFLRNMVYGFNDGLTANFGLVAGVLGADFTIAHVLLSGISGAVADALSMASSGYLAAKSEREVYSHEIAMEREEISLMPELEQEELSLIYQLKGLNKTEAETLAHHIIKDPDRALDEMVREELKIGAEYSSPLGEAVITGISTAVGAIIPVLPFFFLNARTAAWTAFIIAMLAHFGVGAARSVFTGRGIIRSGIDMFVVGLGVAAIAYFIGDLLVRFLTGV